MSFLCLTTFDRWASTTSSMQLRQMSSGRIARYLFLCSFIFWSLINIPFLIYSDLMPSNLACWFTNDHFSQIVNYFLIPFLYTISPLIVLSILVTLTYRNIHSITHFQQQQIRFHQRKWEKLLTRMIIIQTVFSILCTFPRAFFLLYWLASKTLNRSSIELFFNQITIFIGCLNYTSSFYIYLYIKISLKYSF